MSTNESTFEQSSLGMIANNLTDQERHLINLIRQAGAAAPAELAVKTFMLPEEADQILNDLGQKGLITSQSVESTASPQLVRLTDLGLRIARFELMKKMR